MEVFCFFFIRVILNEPSFLSTDNMELEILRAEGFMIRGWQPMDCRLDWDLKAILASLGSQGDGGNLAMRESKVTVVAEGFVIKGSGSSGPPTLAHEW